MRRRLPPVLRVILLGTLLACLLLSACGEKPDGETYEALAAMHAPIAAQTRATLEFRMEASFRDPDTGESGVLYALNGETRYDVSQALAWQRFTATRLAATVNAEEFYENGVRTHLESGQVSRLETDPEAMFGAFPYRTVPLPALAELKSLKTEENSSGLLYTLVASAGQKQLVDEIWGIDLYALAGITVPDREKESYGDVTYGWSVTNGEISALFVQLTVALYEQAAYTPGHTPNDADHRLELTLQAQIFFRDAGDSVEIPVYDAE